MIALPPSRRALLGALSSLVLLATTTRAETNLWDAADGGDANAVRAAVTAGTAVDSRDSDGLTALMHAAIAAQFGVMRELLELDADATLTTPSGTTVLDCIPDDATDGVACRMLIRANVFLRDNLRPSNTPPRQPNLVVAFEPTVNYLHPSLKPFYYVNLAEKNGKPGVDDDLNGFADDFYGWNLEQDRAHAINSLQFQVYLQSRDVIAHLFEQYNAHKLGTLDDDAYEEVMSGYENPLAQIFGRGAGFTNGDFLEKALGLSHGSHVAGIIIEHSQHQALLHTISWEAFGDSKPLVPTTSYRQLFDDTNDLPSFLDAVRTEMLKTSLATGRRMSDYLRATGAGVVNMSMSSSFASSARQAEQLATNWIDATGNTITEDQQESWEHFLKQIAFEFYSADALQFVIPMAENPDVLFVVAAGNDDSNNDMSFQAPAYLSRFFPNVITVAAVNGDDTIAGFSNYGVHSVDIAAPGVNIASTVIPESSVLMDGTSMAAPAVAGAAAYVRHQDPALTAREIKKRLLYATSHPANLDRYIATGGVLDDEVLARTVSTENSVRANGLAAMAYNAAISNSEYIPEQRTDAETYSLAAIAADPTSGFTWWARSVTLDLSDRTADARKAAEMAVNIDASQHSFWNSLAIICEKLDDPNASLNALSKAIELTTSDPDTSDRTRLSYLYRRATVQLALGQRSAARADVAAILALAPDTELDPELQALKP